MTVSKAKIAVVDLETTGPNRKEGDQIIQIAAVIYCEGQIIEQVSQLVNPLMDLPFEISQLTGINDDDLLEAPTWDQIADEWWLRLQDCILVAHNINFDYKFLQQFFKEYGYDYQPLRIDTVVLSQILLPQSDGFSLSSLSRHLAVAFEDAHDALSDAKFTTYLLANLAQQVVEMEASVRDQLLLVMKHLNDDESYFMSHAADYVLGDPQSIIDGQGQSIRSRKLKDETHLSLQLAKWMEEQARPHYSILFEDPDRPISPAIMKAYAYLQSRRGPVLLSIPDQEELPTWLKKCQAMDPSLNCGLLLPSSSFIHLEAFESVLALVGKESFNQLQLIQMAACYYWLSHSNTGNYQEIHSHLHCHALIDKYAKSIKENQPHTFYLKNKKKCLLANFCLVDHTYLPYSLQVMPVEFSQQRRLLVYDTHSLAHELRYYYARKLNLSNLLLQLRRINEGSLAVLQGERIRNLQEIIKKCLQDLSHFLKAQIQQNKQSSLQVIEKYLSFNQPIWNQLQANLQLVSQDLERLILEIREASEESLADLNKFLLDLKSIAACQRVGWYLSARASFSHGQFFDLNLILTPLVINKDYLAFMDSFKQVSLISLGNYTNDQLMTNYTGIQGQKLVYLTLPKLNQQRTKLRLEIPLEFINEQTEDLQLTAQLLLDHIKLNDLQPRLAIVASNQEQLHYLYQVLGEDSDIINRYRLLACGVTGNASRIKRRLLETDTWILLGNRRQIQSLSADMGAIDISVYIQRLPFQSFDHVQFQAIKDQVNLDDSGIFEQFVYPRMVQTLKELLVTLNAYHFVSPIFLMDARVFTKNYSLQLRQDLQAICEIESS
ncbi:3'-5' exonuclease [Hutsoniella sourekii]